MTKHPATFREWISGDFPYSDPPSWTCKLSKERVALVPSAKVLIASAAIFCGFSIFVPIVVWTADSKNDFAVATILVGGGVLILGLGASGFMTIVFLRNYIRGPFLIYTAIDRSILLPRERLRFPISEVIHWRAVSGNRVGPAHSQKRKKYSMSELQLIVRVHDEAIAYVIVGNQTASISDQARQIANATGVPLEIVIQSQGVSDESSQVPRRWLS